MEQTSWQKWRALRGTDKKTLLLAALLLPAAQALLWWPGYLRTRQWLEKMTPLKQPGAWENKENTLAEARRMAQLVSIAARHGVYKGNCLRQALVLWWLLRKWGMQTEIRFGSRKGEQGLEAHAWVEWQGKLVSAGGQGADYLPFKAEGARNEERT